jgi:hypothetical protein
MLVSDRTRIDIIHIFHCLPPPDYCPYILFRKSLKNYDNSNPVNAETFAEFIDYSKAVHVARAAYAGNCVTNMKIEPGYEEKVYEFVEKARRSRD